MKAKQKNFQTGVYFNETYRAAVAQWLRLELRCERSQVRSPLYMSFRFGRNLALHHTNVLALCWCLVSSSRVYCILSTMNLPQGRTLNNIKRMKHYFLMFYSRWRRIKRDRVQSESNFVKKKFNMLKSDRRSIIRRFTVFFYFKLK